MATPFLRGWVPGRNDRVLFLADMPQGKSWDNEERPHRRGYDAAPRCVVVIGDPLCRREIDISSIYRRDEDR